MVFATLRLASYFKLAGLLLSDTLLYRALLAALTLALILMAGGATAAVSTALISTKSYANSYTNSQTTQFQLLSANTIRKNTVTLKLMVYSEHFHFAIDALNGKEPCHQKSLYNQAHVAHMETILLCKALYLGGLEVSYQIISVPNQVRAVKLLEAGEGAVFAGSIWGYLASDNLSISAALLEHGEYEKGLYTSIHNHSVLVETDAEKIQQLKAVTGATWDIDRQLLDCLGMIQYHAARYPQMLRMVYSQRADIFLQNFTQEDDLSLHDFGTILKPIPGFKVSMPDSLHYLISKTYPHSSDIVEAINTGIHIMKENGDLRQAYEDVGFYNPKVKDWQTLSCR